MEFKFNFAAPPSNDDETASITAQPTVTTAFTEESITILPAREVFVCGKEEELDEMAIDALFEKVSINDDVSLSRCRPPNSSSMSGPLAEAIDQSDLIPGIYEGGFKIWECSLDLIRYLHEIKVPLQGKRVMELGCGHAFPGIYALNLGAQVDFQDYNPEVIEEVTAPNIIINCKDLKEERPRYFCGDWGSLAAVAGADCYDIILTSETIYSTESTGRLLSCISALLKKDTGVAYIAAKSYYFGVGGSTLSFIEAARAQLPGWQLDRARKWEDGASNVREILVLRAPAAAAAAAASSFSSAVPPAESASTDPA